jgi:hypothetical protein
VHELRRLSTSLFLVLGFGLVRLAVAVDLVSPSPAAAGAIQLAPEAVGVVTCPPKPPAEPCEILTCRSGEWMSTYKATPSGGPRSEP